VLADPELLARPGALGGIITDGAFTARHSESSA
jgi:hypothetical protein